MSRLCGTSRYTLSLLCALVVFTALTVACAPTRAEGDPPPPDSSTATHEQVKLIRCNQDAEGWKLSCFATTKDGNILAVIAPAKEEGLHGLIAQAQPKKQVDDADRPAAEVRVFDAEGELLSKWPLTFLAQAVNVGPDGMVYLAGDGSIARYDMSGKELVETESPQIVAARQDPAELKRRAREELEQEQHSAREQLENLEAQKQELASKKDDELDDDEKEMKKMIDQYIAIYKERASKEQDQAITDEQVKERVEELAARARRTNALAVNDQYVFATGPASKGYGYRVWRTDLDFKNAVAIVDGLSGCCGQMDIQCCGDEIVVAENSRHRVVRYDADGKEIASFGKRSRDGAADCFGGCCNPMNTRTVGDKLYVAESDGQVKLFTLAGQYEGLVAVAKVQPGCKSSTVAVSPDENRVYYIDVNNSGICVLDRKRGSAPQGTTDGVLKSAGKPKP